MCCFIKVRVLKLIISKEKHIFHHIQGTIILILMFWGPTIGFLEVLNRTGKAVKWLKVKVKRFYQGQSSKTPKI